MLTKPCAREGCSALICESVVGRRFFARRRFCCVRCAALDRYAHGVPLPTTTHAQRVEGGRRGGLKAGERRRKHAAQRAVDAVLPLLAEDILGRLPYLEQCKLKAAMVRIWFTAYTAGKSAARVARMGKGRAA